MWIGLLGPLEVRDGAGDVVSVNGARLRGLLARLALDPGRPVTADALVDAVWGARPPTTAKNTLQSLIYRLRRALPAELADRLESLPSGYRLAISADSVDTVQFERLAGDGRAARAAGDLAAAHGHFTQALGLWRGQPLDDLDASTAAEPVAARLTELRLQVVEERAEIGLAAGAPDDVIAGLAEPVATHPLRERLHLLYMRALHAAGRPGEALSVFERLRGALAESLGTDPSPQLRDLHLTILRGDCGPQQPRSNLRAPLTSFVGRDEERKRVHRLLDEARLVTLVGPGGAGKTRLAAEVAADRMDRVQDGVWLVELAGVNDPNDVPAAIAAAVRQRDLGLLSPGPGAGRDPTDRLIDWLRGRDVLLVLDNCEHLLDACAQVADTVLGECPGVRVLATSREPLGIIGETLCRVGPLGVPAETVDVAEAPYFSALRLFADRAAAVRPGFALTPENLPAVVEVCRRLDGLPLAIELACARLRTLPVTEIAARLGDRFRLLTGGSRTALPRHRTLYAVVDWSWNLLAEPERTVARRFAVFAGGATAEATEVVCASPGEAVPDVLGALVDKSFLELLEERDAPPRYRMLHTIRAYAEDALAEAGEAADVRRAHAAYFLRLAETAEPALRTADQLDWMARLTRERDNMTAALRWAVDSADAASAVRLVAALGWFWAIRESSDEPRTWLREVLAMPGADPAGATVPAETLAIAYAYAAIHHFGGHDLDQAATCATIARRLIDGRLPAHPAVAFVTTIIQLDSIDASSAMASIAGLADHPDPWIAAAARLARGHAAATDGDTAGSLRAFSAARDAFSAVGDRWGVMMAISALGSGQSLEGDHAAVIAAMGEAIQLAETVGADGDAAWMRVRRGLEHLRAGDVSGARSDFRQGRAAGAARRSELLVAFADSGLGELARHNGDHAQARKLLTGALGRLDGIEGALPPRVRVLALTWLARAELAADERGTARAYLDEAWALATGLDDGPSAAGVAEALAELALADGEPLEAARLLGLATSIRGSADRGSPDVRRAERAARAALGEDYDAAYAASAALPATEAVGVLSARPA